MTTSSKGDHGDLVLFVGSSRQLLHLMLPVGWEGADVLFFSRCCEYKVYFAARRLPGGADGIGSTGAISLAKRPVEPLRAI
jgi:hypothetical protein